MTQYEPKKHHRRSIRLPGYDYRSPGAYFVTICVRGGECLLGDIVDGKMQPNDFGRIAAHYWQRTPRYFLHVELDEWVVMPNHLHGLIVFVDFPRTGGEECPAKHSGFGLATPDESQTATGKVPGHSSPLRSGSLGAVVGTFKSVSTRRINRKRQMPGAAFWQRNYWEHVVRNEGSLNRIREYIQGNPVCWTEDQLHPAALPNPFNQWPAL